MSMSYVSRARKVYTAEALGAAIVIAVFCGVVVGVMFGLIQGDYRVRLAKAEAAERCITAYDDN